MTANKKISFVGRGTVGCLGVAHFLKGTDCEIDWIFDPSIPPTAVGEGTTLTTPNAIHQNLKWYWDDLKSIRATPKTGIYKENWGKNKPNYLHPFPVGGVGMHFNAVEFQDKAFNQLRKDSRINIVEAHVTNFEDLDTDHVLVCAGSPKNKNELVEHKEIPVNSAYVTQCFWDYPRFDYTLTIARPYGWVFGIPLQNRCSIGYLYNKDINTLEEVKQDVQNIFEDYNLKPSDVTNHLNFNNYSRKINHTKKVAYSGNASFFLEPLEATSLALADSVFRLAYSTWFDNWDTNTANNLYTRQIDDIKAMICLHYIAGSAFDTPFWSQAKESAEGYIKSLYESDSFFSKYLMDALRGGANEIELGYWSAESYRQNVKGLGIEELLEQYELQREKYIAA